MLGVWNDLSDYLSTINIDGVPSHIGWCSFVPGKIKCLNITNSFILSKSNTCFSCFKYSKSKAPRRNNLDLGLMIKKNDVFYGFFFAENTFKTALLMFSKSLPPSPHAARTLDVTHVCLSNVLHISSYNIMYIMIYDNHVISTYTTYIYIPILLTLSTYILHITYGHWNLLIVYVLIIHLKHGAPGIFPQ